jgi:hypothetical protein
MIRTHPREHIGIDCRGESIIGSTQAIRLVSAAVLSLFLAYLVVRPQSVLQSQPAGVSAEMTSIDGMIAAMYAVISGTAEKQRDWSAMRSLFFPGAILIRTAPDRNGKLTANILTPDDYVTRAGTYFETHRFFEHEISRKTETWGNIAHVFSTYESRTAEKDQKVLARGINSIQLYNDGKRWWILSIAWQEETPELPLPKDYLP